MTRGTLARSYGSTRGAVVKGIGCCVDCEAQTSLRRFLTTDSVISSQHFRNIPFRGDEPK